MLSEFLEALNIFLTKIRKIFSFIVVGVVVDPYIYPNLAKTS